MGLKKLPYWLTGAIISNIILWPLGFIFPAPLLAISFLMDKLINLKYFIIYILALIFIYTLIGALIGFIYGKIRKK